jgi:Putative prokaryotic signal transducing protein
MSLGRMLSLPAVLWPPGMFFSAMPEGLITIATYFSEPEFLLARARLESADIECFAQDENMLRMAGWHSHILGGIKLQVWESDAADALAVLGHRAPIDPV